MTDALIVRGAREHNLKNVDLEIPRNALVVFSGLSGSGKSSLAFDTIFAEGQRRYVESLSSYARQFLGQMDKPKVEFIEGLSPAVSIDQKSTNRNPRSTVGTITEIHDYLRLLYARTGVQHCPTCGAEISSQSAEQMVDALLAYPEGTRFQLLAPVIKGRKGEHADLLSSLQSQGFSRARIDGEVMRLSEDISLAKTKKHTIEVIVDRLAVKSGSRTRLTDSVETATRLAGGVVIADFVNEAEGSPERTRRFSEKRACPNEHPLELEEIEPRSFSFNAPYGACPECSGIGTRLEIDPDLVIPDESATLAEGAIAPWTLGSADHHQQVMSALASELGFSMDTPWKDLPDDAKDALLNGHNFKVHVRYRNRFGRERRYSTGFEGVMYYLKRRHEDTESDWARERYEQFMRHAPCPACQGRRLRPEVLSITIGGKSIAEFSDLPIGEAKAFLEGVEFSSRDLVIADEILREIHARLGFLVDVGLNYLNLSRAAGTLSGGEAQRIRLATQIGSGLVGVLYVLDEPSIGLHQRDNQRLIHTLVRLRDLGNTLIVVEHDEDTLRTADWIVDIGPNAGEYGGEVVYSGAYEGLLEESRSITGQYLSGERAIDVPKERRKVDPGRVLKVVNARENNLQGVNVTVPLGLFTAVTGVSGSGKSTLVNDILYRVLAKTLNRARVVPGRHTRVEGLEHLDKVVHVDQSPIGRTPRSNPATYTGVWDRIRTLFAQTSEAKVRGYKAGRFSFNVKGGRCENCAGDGTIKIEMNFLPDVYVKCEVCHGARYNSETLQVRFKGKNVAEVLDMPISEAVEFFEAVPAIHRQLSTLVEVGLGYVRLGQSATTLSGGEAQRVKLAAELHKRSKGRTIYVLDEPTTGLHFEDIKKLLSVLQGLVDKGNSVVVIEHNLDVIKSADYLIDLGPEGGSGGGRVIATGTPEDVAKVDESFTGQFLRELL
ncbi:excinuclease ABC subunit UvrA [Dermabacter hominis]|uniref:excinuclease ABC subunit UvrA n=1 Tax=Dermabacter hominis TaxID=36740 RepID=UPI0021A5B9C9|nr:excinuclease ABC subunit UvrA [Dermabacter hominis]MCT2055602.1 excinuclease ABC subunit UvrA [Dermabacter hominis]MCT2082916.1 excinuclease ABC subunit UvrA [Dermabacter hominis]MCT2091915.1 excinuclease ABC subunit UvrA [Dermabacter hominis]MCT2190538.1 excinuclease ABC subunit UvrA [Dermabacter hominis]MCT2227485.1 excinuclease ABC subunit UvrA [Dermabacter hominis]